MWEFFTPDGVRAAVSVGWLLLAILVFSFCFPILTRIMRERAFTVEIAGFKLSAQQTADNLTSAIKDLQESVSRLEQQASLLPATPSIIETEEKRGGSILWVDDYPINNALILEKLEEDGFHIDKALSTRDGMKQFTRRRYDLILTDMGRKEGGQEVPDAGVRLVEQIRKSDASIPIVVYCGSRARELHGQRAIDAGANNITSSHVELYVMIDEALNRPRPV